MFALTEREVGNNVRIEMSRYYMYIQMKEIYVCVYIMYMYIIYKCIFYISVVYMCIFVFVRIGDGYDICENSF